MCGCIGCGEACDFPTLVDEVADASEQPARRWSARWDAPVYTTTSTTTAGGGALVTHQFCQDVQPIVGCMVAPGEMCLECTAVADPRVVCQR